jgi:hypothetical protein
MTKKYLVHGSNWTAEVEIPNAEVFNEDQLPMEAATRAVEAMLDKRQDIDVSEFVPKKLSKKEKAQDEMFAAIWELLTEELEPGCGIGMLLGITDITDGKKDEPRFINSKKIMENVGIPSLVDIFDAKYPSTNKQTT